VQDYANAIKKLALRAFSRTDLEEQRELVYEAFFRTMNNGGLQRYYLAAKISTIEKAMEMGQSYYQVDEPMERTSPPAKWRKHPKRRPK